MTLLLKLVNLSADKYLHKCFVRSLPSSSCFAGSCIQHTCCRQQKASPYDLVLSNSLLASIIPLQGAVTTSMTCGTQSSTCLLTSMVCCLAESNDNWAHC